jgi:hypothetical protein
VYFGNRCEQTPYQLQYAQNIILAVILYWFETLSLTFRKEHRLRVLGNIAPMKIVATKWEEVIGGYRNIHKEGSVVSVTVTEMNEGWHLSPVLLFM